jgi:glycyl-tRNA synthetase beta chain
MGRPAGLAGAVIGIADRVDNICAFFAQGYKATGSEDPYGARRDAQGLIEILMRNTQAGSLPINGLVDRELELISERSANKNAKSEIMSFIRQRVRTFFKEENIEYDESDAVMETALNINLRTAVERARVIQRFREREDFKKFIIAFKRVVNILKQAEIKRVNESTSQRVNEEMLKEKEEKVLYEAYLNIKEEIKTKIEKNNFAEAMEKLLLSLGKPIDDLFDHVMVMADDEQLKANRLAVLSEIAYLFLLVADFSKIVLGERESAKK